MFYRHSDNIGTTTIFDGATGKNVVKLIKGAMSKGGELTD